MMIAETIVEHVAVASGIAPHVVRSLNMYGKHGNGQTSPVGMAFDPTPLVKCWDGVLSDSSYEDRLAEISTFNASSRYVKRGIAAIPTMFGISFTMLSMNQAGALVHVYHTDGSVLISHGGVEMGQGLHSKMCQVAADALNVPLEKVYVSETATDKVPNSSPTAASASSDLYGMAVLDACTQLAIRLDAVRATLPLGKAGELPSWEQVTNAAWLARVDLSAHGFYRTPGLDAVDLSAPGARGRPFHYYTNGAAVTEVEVDALTGEHSVLRADIVMDVGRPLNPALDVGQIEGAFVQGLGWCTSEEVVRGGSSSVHRWLRAGQMHTLGPGAYKIPAFGDIPAVFNVRVLDGVRNEQETIHGSKAIGEPPLFLAASAFFAIRAAASAARADGGCDDKRRDMKGWIEVDSPASVERIRIACGGPLVDGSRRPDLSL
jgi:xanthine dehydrogenase/oxidase